MDEINRRLQFWARRHVGGDIAEKNMYRISGLCIINIFFASINEVVCDHKIIINPLYYISLKNNSTWMLNAQHFGYEPVGTYKDAPLYHRRRYKEVKLSRLATLIIK